MAYPGWIFHCIGLLMMAAIPIREERIVRKDREPRASVTLTPSQDMIATGLKMDFQLRQPPIEHERGDHIGKSEFFDHINSRGQIEDGFSQLDYLALAADVVSRGTGNGPVLVHFSWVNAIQDAIHRLSRDRQQLQAANPNEHAAQWVDNWQFDIPKYDKEVGSYDASGSACLLKFNPASRTWG
ncbi:hypothetical protein F4803DRAFT_531109 [Xylaria telfairii]|nr:hypothetical protein F4803DRAFT_531109 [Xylaria telfairii]